MRHEKDSRRSQIVSVSPQSPEGFTGDEPIHRQGYAQMSSAHREGCEASSATPAARSLTPQIHSSPVRAGADVSVRATSVRLAVERANERKGPRWAGAGGHHLLVQPSEIGLSVHVEPLRQKMESEAEASRLLKCEPEHLCRAPRDPWKSAGLGARSPTK